MGDFANSYLGRLRAIVGSRLLLVPGQRVVVENAAGAVLLQLRSDFGLWGLPGGVPDEGEGGEATAIRETFEETGILLRDPRPFGVASDPAYEIWTYPNGDRCHYFTTLYWSRSFEGRLIGRNDESLAVGWFAPDALPDLMPVMRRTLDAYRAFRETGEFQTI
jgi:8-oxo-dGTP pyrophosphatase MutT (NUDIX family)